MISKKNPTKSAFWEKLSVKAQELKNSSVSDLFEQDPNRFDNFSIQTDDILIDFSKNLIDEKVIDLLIKLAKDLNLKSSINQLFNGDPINETERRSVLHTALRNFSDEPVFKNGENVMLNISGVLYQMEEISDKLNSGTWRGYSDKPILDVVNIGIGGSDLGPRMVTEALKPYSENINPHFISNIDSSDIIETLKNLNPETTIFIIVSKSFTTPETRANAKSALDWYLKSGDKEKIDAHFIAVTADRNAAAAFGIPEKNILEFWEWVGGRYSLWSAAGLTISITLGHNNFKELLKGAYSMDMHFKNSAFESNAPVILGLLGIWYINFWDAHSFAILPYDQYLNEFPAYLQQVDMESNGKSVNRSGEKINYPTGPVIWGEPGTNGQHAFYQLIHQGTQLIPCDFLAPVISQNPIENHHYLLLANFFAQSQALMNGKSEREIRMELKKQNLSENQINFLAPFKVFKGNKPSNSILYKKLTPKTLGQLIALYEHKIFVQGVIWNIFSFDQWGVELGKQLADEILPELENNDQISTHDSSTNGLINRFKLWRRK